MGQTPDRKQSLLICFILSLVTFASYWQVKNNAFIDFDDPLYVTENKNVQSGFTPDAFKWAFTTNQAYNWHPLTWFSLMLDYKLFGLKPAGYHFTNLIFHVANSILLFLIFRLMTGALWRSALVAALFALHPLHVESVAWVSERKDVLSTFFWVLTMWFYVRYAQRPSIAAYIPVFIALALGLMAKQMLVTLPFVLLLIDYWPLNRIRNPQSAIRNFKFTIINSIVEKLPLFVLSGIACLIVLYVQSKATLVRGMQQFPIDFRIENVLLAYAGYVGKLFYPLNLGILYPYPLTDPPMRQVAAAGLLILCVTIAVFRFSNNRRWLIVGWLWFLGTLIPVIGLVQVGLQSMADRYTYIPLIGLFIIIAWGITELAEKLKCKPAVLAASAAIVLSFLSFLTYRQVSFWKDSITLFEHTVAVTRDNDILHYNLGRLYLQKGDSDKAIYHWSEAVRIKPDQPTIHKNLAALLVQNGDIDKAIYHYRQALTYRPDDAQAQDNLRDLLKKAR
ncbi:MAG: tetratricopeptide repeat protein [Sedimentisphaerales bacterium]